MFDLTGKKALITGATGGIGLAIATALHGAGATVALSGTRKEKLDEIVATLGERAFAVPANLSDMESVDALPKTAIEVMGGLDILVNNAGITRDNLAMRMKDDEWDDVLNVNLKASFKLSKAVLRPMMKARHGRIINITSVVGTTGNAGQVNYAASKAGTVGMSKSMAQEVASRGITVNCVAPGFIATPMTDVLDEKQREAILQNIPISRLGNPEEIAASVLYLASDEAAYVTGQTLHVNGGMAMI
ncbi:MAG: 3-oxoacyl-ACP reductase FabG [Sphingomonadales bacterium]|nr:3-oxoacyl-ACP reductase FabG [Sphingomonadales bacterium]